MRMPYRVTMRATTSPFRQGAWLGPGALAWKGFRAGRRGTTGSVRWRVA